MARDATNREAVGVEESDAQRTGPSWEDGLQPVLVRPAGRRPLSLRETLSRDPSPGSIRASKSTMRLLCTAVWLLSGVGTATAAWSVRQTMFPSTSDPAPASVWQNASTSEAPDHSYDDQERDATDASPETRPIAVRPEDRYGHEDGFGDDDEADDSSGPGSGDDQASGTPKTSDDSSGPSASSGSGPGAPTTAPEVDDSSGSGSDDGVDNSGSSGSGSGGSGTDRSGTGSSTDSGGSGSNSGSGSSDSGSDDVEP